MYTISTGLKLKTYFTLMDDEEKLEAGIKYPSSRIGLILRKYNVDYKRYGCSGMLDMLSKMPEFITIEKINETLNDITISKWEEAEQSKKRIHFEQAKRAEALTEEIKKEIYALLINSMEFEVETPSAYVSLLLNNNGYSKERFGFSKMKELFENLEYFSQKVVEMNGVPQILLTLHKAEEYDILPNEDIVIKTVDDKDAKNRLFNFALFGNFESACQNLADIALEENWGDHNRILANYLKYTFAKQKADDHIGYSADKTYAAFNTGLFNKKYDSIIALFEKNKNADDPRAYYFKSFCVMGTRGDGKILTENFKKDDLERAAYFSKFDDFYYDYKKPYVINDEHILIENINRLPLKFIEKYSFGDEKIKELIDLIKITPYDNAGLYDKLKDTIRSNDTVYDQLQTQLESSINLACTKKIQQNYKMAVPAYHPHKSQMSFLMPLALTDKYGAPEVALVISLSSAGNYQCHTILDLNMAYLDARLITRPDSEWLRP